MQNSKRILIAPNSFKECADSSEVALHIAKTLKEKYSSNQDNYNYQLLPLSDGGDGFLSVIALSKDVQFLKYTIPNTLLNSQITVEAAYSVKEKIVYIESAKTIGISLVPKAERVIMQMSSYPMGLLMLELIKQKRFGELDFNKIVIGIGGTGVNDFGIGMLSVFGLLLLDKLGNQLNPLPENFGSVDEIVLPEIPNDIKFEIVVDSINPLTGEKGASLVYGPQKGASLNEANALDNSFIKLLKIYESHGIKRDDLVGAGGGIAAAFQLFFNAIKIDAKSFINDYLYLERAISDSDLIITGEGKVDNQNEFEKAVGIVIDSASRQNKELVLICGIAENIVSREKLTVIEMSKFFNSIEESIYNWKEGIEKSIDKMLSSIEMFRGK
ncbi:MAG: glycerate kinase [Melioribacteraceae bacterium]